jgi:hypothetical protein
MDLNIGSALWCAAHAAGRLQYPQLPAWRSAARCRAAQRCAGANDGAEQPASPKAAGNARTGTSSSVTAKAGAAGASAAGTSAGSVEALWQPAGEGVPYRSCARVALLGHGADEQCGGYGRHRTTFCREVHISNATVSDACFWTKGLAFSTGAATAALCFRDAYAQNQQVINAIDEGCVTVVKAVRAAGQVARLLLGCTSPSPDAVDDAWVHSCAGLAGAC